MTIEFNGNSYDNRHGGPFDRGSADSWYDRPHEPHYFVGDTHQSPRVAEVDMTSAQITAYSAGYAWNEQHGGKKDWN
jgi:hypothetical protein